MLRIFLLALFLCTSLLARAEEVGADGLTSSELSQFLQKLQAAVASDNVSQVQTLVSFPLRVNNNGKSRKVNAAQFASSYASIFTPKIKSVLAAQKASALFRNSEGAMVGDGEIWMSGICKDKACKQSQVMVITVNVP